MAEITIKDDWELYKFMKMKVFRESRDLPGPYWSKTAKVSAKQIEKFGISNFRNFGTNIGQSYSDAPNIDIRPNLINFPVNIFANLLSNISPLKRIYDNQVNLTKSLYQVILEKESFHIQNSERIKKSLQRFSIPENTLAGNCIASTYILNREIANIYLEGIVIIDKIEDEIGLKDCESFMEIGPGFGVNVHLIIQNYKNIKKILIVDIFPTLYVVTQYLKFHFPDSITDCRKFDSEEFFDFKDDDLEIICILPSQLKRFRGKIDFAYNAHSFIEMPPELVANYGVEISRLQENSNIKKLVLCSYLSNMGSGTTNPDMFSELLERNFREVADVWPRDGYNKNIFYFSR